MATKKEYIDELISYLTNLRNEDNEELIDIFISSKHIYDPSYLLNSTIVEFEPVCKEIEILIKDYRKNKE